MHRIFFIFFVSTILVACSDSGDGNGTQTDVQGLSLPKSINIAAPKDGNINQAALRPSNFTIAANYTDVNTDYSTDSVTYYSGIDEFFDLESINEFLCAIDALRVKEMVNQGAYIARVTDSICEQNNELENSSSEASSSYTEFVVLSTRINNQSPHIIKLWVPFDVNGFNIDEAGAITPMGLLEITINESASDQNPYGDFDYNFKSIVDASLYGGMLGDPTTFGLANFHVFKSSADYPRIEYIYRSGNMFDSQIDDAGVAFSETVEMFDQNGDSGRAKLNLNFGVNYESTRAADFDSTHLKTVRIDNGAESQSCNSRTEYTSYVDDYNLYFEQDGEFRSNTISAGQRVELNTNFYFTYEGQFGSASEWGYWLLGDGQLADQAVVTGNDNGDSYTVHMSPGKLSYIDRSGSIIESKAVFPNNTQLFGEPPSEVELFCYTKCPIGGMTQDQINSATSTADLFYDDKLLNESPYTYSVTADNYKVILKDNNNAGSVVNFSHLDWTPIAESTMHYLSSGPLYTEVYSANNNTDIIYNWGFGNGTHAQLVVFENNTNIVQFEPKLQFSYTHYAVNDRFNTDPNTNNYHNAEMTLYYSGAGSLYGFPYGDTSSSGPLVSLRDGVSLNNDEGSFIAKATGISRSYIEKELGECSNLNANAVLNDSNFSLPTTEDLTELSFSISDRPNISGTPKVIDGVIQN